MINEDSSLYIAPNFESGYMVPRADMPQLENKHVKSFLKDHGVDSKIEHRSTSELKPTQSQFNPEKIASMDKTGMSKPILISSDDYVLDGHHRWLANHYNKTKQATIKLPWDVPMSLKLLNDYDKTFSKDIHEDAAPVVAIGGPTPAIDNSIPVVKKKTFLQWRADKKVK